MVLLHQCHKPYLYKEVMKMMISIGVIWLWYSELTGWIEGIWRQYDYWWLILVGLCWSLLVVVGRLFVLSLMHKCCCVPGRVGKNVTEILDQDSIWKKQRCGSGSHWFHQSKLCSQQLKFLLFKKVSVIKICKINGKKALLLNILDHIFGRTKWDLRKTFLTKKQPSSWFKPNSYLQLNESWHNHLLISQRETIFCPWY